MLAYECDQIPCLLVNLLLSLMNLEWWVYIVMTCNCLCMLATCKAIAVCELSKGAIFHQTKSFLSRTVALCVRFDFCYIFLPVICKATM